MFTGLIEEIGEVRRISRSPDGANLVIGAQTVLADLNKGDSIAVSGPCLTVIASEGNTFTAYAMPETLQRTTLSSLAAGYKVNLERALALGGRLGGHLVSGHVDAIVTLTGRERQGGALILFFEAPGHLLRYVVPKGSVALDGVSLTVVEVGESGFSVGLIPHTSEQTTLGHQEVGTAVNLEVDLVGKYIEKMLQPRQEKMIEKGGPITISLLQEKGYF